MAILAHLKHEWNLTHHTQQEKIKAKDTDGDAILKEFRDKLRCNQDQCVQQYFNVPEMPSEWTAEKGRNKSSWLSNYDIMDVLRQYERRFKCFKLIGPVSIDFDTHLQNGQCVDPDLCNFDLQKLQQAGKFKISIIFNTAKHDKKGEHWIALFINIRKKNICYFDSTGSKMSSEVAALVKRVVLQGKIIGVNFKTQTNTKQHQNTSTECGMYVLFFSISMIIDSKSMNDFNKFRIPDDAMKLLRLIYFKPQT